MRLRVGHPLAIINDVWGTRRAQVERSGNRYSLLEASASFSLPALRRTGLTSPEDSVAHGERRTADALSQTPNISDYLRLDARYLQRRGFLQPGRFATLQWSRNGEPFASMGLRVDSTADPH
jgi:hypothetical protein